MAFQASARFDDVETSIALTRFYVLGSEIERQAVANAKAEGGRLLALAEQALKQS